MLASTDLILADQKYWANVMSTYYYLIIINVFYANEPWQREDRGAPVFSIIVFLHVLFSFLKKSFFERFD